MFSDSGARAVAARGRSRSSWPAISGVKSISAPRAFAVWIACTIACALRSGSIPLVIWKIAVRHNGSGLEEQIQQIGRAHVCTPVTNAHLECRHLLQQNNKKYRKNQQ